MVEFNFIGNVSSKLYEKKGTSLANGKDWVIQKFLFINGGDKIVIETFNYDLSEFIDKIVDVVVIVSTNEYNGNYYTKLTLKSLSVLEKIKKENEEKNLFTEQRTTENNNQSLPF